ncbi:putative bifunctional diguanylate cyclase/phosphodiesterase [Streptomyces litchfieldiae]|uniref:EAL domain-containing protein n=1 Tax=Streptomyces litchfieldiae TaxID=3075543 RepID=A0ABU2MI17_9ACTN|nr:EAL domain-containing protein [Streptomyces sp. DSM 44938]MDT0341223.1 EAL domain-containing protein [Streptomyces sp. DSM 44938]
MHRSRSEWPAEDGPAAHPLSGAVPQLALAAVCAGYATGAVLGWGSPQVARAMGDFGLSAAAFLAAGSCLWYARRGAGEFHAAWTLFGLSSIMMGLGNAIWGWYEVVLRQPVPRISSADLCFLLFAPLAIVGLLMLAKRPVTRAGWVCLGLDAWLIGGSMMTLSWSVALAQTAQRQGETVARAALALAYPLLDIALVSTVLVLHFRRSAAHRPAINAAVGALALTVLCDALFTSPMMRERYSSGQLLDAGWFAGSLLLACSPWLAARGREAAAVRAADGADGTAPPGVPLAGPLTALVPYLAAAVCVLSILFTVINGRDVDRVVVFAACGVVLALLVRQGITLMDNVSLTRELAQKENYFRSLVQGSSDVIMIADPDGRLRYVSPAATGVYGQEAERLTGSELSALIHPDDFGRVQHELRRFLSVPAAREPATRIECRVRHGAGHWLNVESSVKRHDGGLIFNSRDVTERVRLQEQLQHSASHDALTDLPNRALFTERVRLALGGGQGADPGTAVLFIDLDGFKEVNDSAGHQTGDELLIQAAQRLREAVRSGDTTARLGGDEFAALIAGEPGGEPQPHEYRIREIAERVRAALSRPYAIDGRPIRVAASIGVAFAEPGTTPAALMRNADLAMYRAKQSGKGRVELYAPQLQAEAVRRTELADRLGRALRAGEFTLLHQPIVELADGRVAAVSAQARWRCPHGPLATPLEFLRGGRRQSAAAAHPEEEQAAEVTGWLLEQTVAEAARRHRKGHTVPVSVRVPGGRLAARALGAGGVEALLHRHGLPPEALMIELPEAESVLASDELRRRLTDLSGLGVGLALGGFGSGGTAAAALHRLPVHLVRLDGELVDGLLDSPALHKIAAGLLRMASDLGIDSLADGVDHPEQAAALRSMGCRHAQGLAFSEPLEAARLRRVLDEGRLPVPPAAATVPAQPATRRGDRSPSAAADSAPSPIAPT